MLFIKKLSLDIILYRVYVMIYYIPINQGIDCRKKGRFEKGTYYYALCAATCRLYCRSYAP